MKQAGEDYRWHELERQFIEIKSSIEKFRLQTKEEAIDKKPLTEIDYEENFEFESPDLLKYRTTDDRDWMLFCLDKAKELLPLIQEHLTSTASDLTLTMRWGKLQYYNGFIQSTLFSIGDDLGYERAAVKGREKKSKDRHQRWVAQLLHKQIAGGEDRQRAERNLAELIIAILRGGNYPPNSDEKFFKDIVNGNGQLKASYTTKHLSNKRMLNSQSCQQAIFHPLITSFKFLERK